LTDLTVPTFWASSIAALGSIIAAIVGIVLAGIAWKAKQEKKNMSFLKKYREEVDPLLNYFNFLMSAEIYHGNEIEITFTRNPNIGRRILQHLYTCDKTRFVYDLVKDASNGKKVTIDEFQNKFFPIWQELQISTFVTFGACKECVEHIKLKEVQKHKKFLRKSDPKMWDVFGMNSESK